MNEDSKKMILKFLTANFPIKRVKSKKNKKWDRTIIIPSGYTRSTSKNYLIQNELSVTVIVAELVIVIRDFFSYSDDEAIEIAIEYVSGLGTFTIPGGTRKNSRTTPTRRPLI